MPKITITKTEHETGGKFVAHVEGTDATGEQTFSRVNDDLVIVDHTGVDDELAGKGIAKALTENLIRDARENDYRIVPLCPYVRAQSLKHPEWDDVIVKN